MSDGKYVTAIFRCNELGCVVGMEALQKKREYQKISEKNTGTKEEAGNGIYQKERIV